MPKNNDGFKRELIDLLQTKGFKSITMLDSSGEEVPIPEEAEAFQFHYHSDGHDYGTVTVTITDRRQLNIYYNQEMIDDDDSAKDNKWINFLKQLKNFALRNGQMGFKISNVDKLGTDMKKRKYDLDKEKLEEGYYGTKHTSYNDNNPSIRMIIKHSKPIEETDQRFRHIEKIFLENELGERLLAPTKKPSVGRIFARHLAEGGQYNDERWKHITEISEDLSKLGGFVRATRSKQFNESVQNIVQNVMEQYVTLKNDVKKLQGKRGYHQYFENWQPKLMEESDVSNISEYFTINRLDPRIESALPILGKYNISLNEVSEVNEFESWANNVIDEALKPDTDKKIDDILRLLDDESDEMPLGPDAINAIGELEDIIDNDNLNNRLRKAAASDPDNDARPIILGWIEEHADYPEHEEILYKLNKSRDKEETPSLSAPTPPAKKKEEPAPAQEPSVLPPMPQSNAQPPLAEDESLLSRIKKLSGLK
jgi:hypothetical protein